MTKRNRNQETPYTPEIKEQAKGNVAPELDITSDEPVSKKPERLPVRVSKVMPEVGVGTSVPLVKSAPVPVEKGTVVGVEEISDLVPEEVSVKSSGTEAEKSNSNSYFLYVLVALGMAVAVLMLAKRAKKI